MKHGIEVKNIEKNFDEIKALKGVSFHIDKPGLYGIIGPNGAGKTTLLKCISSLLLPSEGEVLINQEKVSIRNLEIRSKIGFLPEDSGLYDKLTSKEFLHIMAGMHGLSKKERGKRVKEVVEFVGLTFPPSQFVKYLSTGQRRLLLFASILLHDPEIIILDESLSGLDPINREQIVQIIRDISKDKIVLFSSHILSDIWRLCERIFVLKEGNLIVDDKPDTIHASMSDNSFFVVPTSEIDIVKDFLASRWNLEELHIRGDRIIFRTEDTELTQTIVKNLLDEFDILSFGPNIPDLDQIFTRLVEAT